MITRTSIERVMHKALLPFFALSTVALLAVGCSSSSPEPSTTEDSAEDTLAASAREEGQVIVYSSLPDASNQALATALQSEYGVTVNVVRLVGAAMSARLMNEHETGAPSADVVISGGASYYDPIFEGVEAGVLLAPDPDVIPEDFPEEFIVPELGCGAVHMNVFGIAYNTDLVSPEDAPTSWTDAADPAFQGSVAMADPVGGSGFIEFFGSIAETYGEDVLRGIFANAGLVSPGGAPGNQSVASGESMIAVPGYDSFIAPLKDQGAPVEIVIPDETYVSAQCVGISAEAEHPNAAMLVERFMLSPEGQEIVNSPVGVASVYDTEALPSKLLRMESREMWADYAERLSDIFAEARN